MTRPSGNPRGRPPKTAIAEIKEKRSVGRPKGEKAILDEYKMRMLASPKSSKVLEKLFEVALNDEHSGQMAAMKLIVDRIAPASSFDVTRGSGGSIPQVTINIAGLSTPTAEIVDNAEDVSYRETEE